MGENPVVYHYRAGGRVLCPTLLHLLRSHPHQAQSHQESPGREYNPQSLSSTGEDQDDDEVQLPVGCVHLDDLLFAGSSW